MKRTTLIYLLVLLASATGVMLIIERGMRLNAPPDLSGSWDVHIDADDNVTAADLGKHVLVEQSGRFVRLSFDGGLRVDLKLAPGTDIRPVDSRAGGLDVQFLGDDWTLTASGFDTHGPLTCELSGPRKLAFVLSRPGPIAHRFPLPPMTQTAEVDAP